MTVPPVCHVSHNPAALAEALEETLSAAGLTHTLRDSHPHLFSPHHVEVPAEALRAMHGVIAAVQRVVATDSFHDYTLANAPAAARHDPRALGVCFGYDFHLTPDGPRLIEINTNAGGALLALALTRAHLSLCPAHQAYLPEGHAPATVEKNLLGMFLSDWRAARGDRPLNRIAIVDDAPETQYLYPEFLLFQNLFRHHGIEAVIAAPDALQLRGNQLHHADGVINLVYNRLTDFALQEPAHAILQRAWLEDLATITPHPRAHALYSDKRALVTLTDTALLRRWGVAELDISTLQTGIAHTRLLDRALGEALWAERKKLFFKPVAGYGSKAVYRGDKLTKRVWEEILGADYVAQTLAPPGEVASTTDGAAFKYDLRHYVYGGQTLFMAARLYQGQTTNFRTPGGGFAPVFCLEHTA